MVDWNGLFKWSMKYQDDGNHSKDFKPMDEKTKEWLTGAMEEYTYDQVKRMKEITEKLSKEEKGTKEDEEERSNMLDELFDVVEEGIENARDLLIIGGFEILINLIFNTKYVSNRLIALQIFSTCNQNNAKIQAASIQLQSFKLINIILNDKDYNIKEREHAFSGLNAMLRGEHLEGKRQFIDAEGVEFILKCIQEIDSKKIKFKAFSVLRDLVLYDSRLHLTVNNTENYANTNAEKSKTAFHHKENEESKESNEKECNKQFKDIVKTKLVQLGFIDLFFNDVIGDFDDSNIDLRSCYAFIFGNIIQFDEKIKDKEEARLAAYKGHFVKLLEVNKQNDGCNEYEIECWAEALKAYVKKK